MGSWSLLFLFVALGSLVTSLTGLGGGTLILAGLLLIYPPEIAIPLHSFTMLTANGLRTGIFFRAVNWKVVGAYAFLMLPAAWGAAKIFEFINPSWLKILVGLFIIVSVIPWKWMPKDEPRYLTWTFLGGVSGFLGVFVGSVGPMVTPFFNRLKLARQGNLSTKAAGQMLLQASKIIAFGGAAGLNFAPFKQHILTLVLASLIGVGISIPISRKISDKRFDQTVNVVLVLLALKILYEGIKELYLYYS